VVQEHETLEEFLSETPTAAAGPKEEGPKKLMSGFDLDEPRRAAKTTSKKAQQESKQVVSQAMEKALSKHDSKESTEEPEEPEEQSALSKAIAQAASKAAARVMAEGKANATKLRKAAREKAAEEEDDATVNSTKLSKAEEDENTTKKTRKAETSPLPSPEPATVAEESPEPATVAEESPAVEPTGCHSLSASLASDEWCMSNCALGNCPMDMCSSDCNKKNEAGPDAQPMQQLKAEGVGCYSFDKGTASDGWCESNCALGNCPEKWCSGGCLRPAKAGGRPVEKVTIAPEAEVNVTKLAKGEKEEEEQQQEEEEDEQEQTEEDEEEPDVDADVTESDAKASKKGTHVAVVKTGSKGSHKADKPHSRVEVWGGDVLLHPKKSDVIKNAAFLDAMLLQERAKAKRA